MRTGILASCCLACAGCIGSASCAAEPSNGASRDRPVTVVLTSSRTEYVLGEPVVLIMTLKNTGRSDVLAWVDDFSYAVDLEIGRVGGPFQRYEHPVEMWDNVDPAIPLPPGQEKVYVFRLLLRRGAQLGESQFVFAEPGRYRAKAKYPLYPIYPTQRMVESNTVEFRIKERQGVDAKVWEQINRPQFLRFVQSGEVRREDGDVVQKAVDVLRRWPKSSYDGAIRWALEQHFRERTRGFGKRGVPSDIKLDPELEAICGVLGIRRVPSGPFPEDKRLDARISYAFLEKTAFEHAFEVISTLSGVPLRVHPELRHRSMVSLPQTTTLRTFMARCGENVVWVRDGNGYKLVPAAVQEPEPQAKKE